MKYPVLCLLFAFAAAMAHAQTAKPTLPMYRQKLLKDTLQMLFPDLQNSKELSVQNNTHVLQLKNEGVKKGSNYLGDIYSMKLDNMPCLKPYKIKDAMPNVMSSKPLLVAPGGDE